MEAYLTISTHFSAAHRLALPQLSYEKKTVKSTVNVLVPTVMAINYHLEVTVKGKIDPPHWHAG